MSNETFAPHAITLTGGRKVSVAEIGSGAPIVYLHGFADVHAASVGWLPFHAALAQSGRLMAPAHPGCGDSDEDESIDAIEDVVFHYLEVLDALGIDHCTLVGTCFGGWVAAELAVRHRERFDRLVLIGASGLFVPGEPIGDLFWEIQPQNGVELKGLRRLLFAREDLPEALELFPDGRSDFAREMSRYKAMRYASRVGFKPPYFYNRNLRDRLHRYNRPALLLWGNEDHMVPLAHADAYRTGLGGGAELVVLSGCGHSPQVEHPKESASAIRQFLP